MEGINRFRNVYLRGKASFLSAVILMVILTPLVKASDYSVIQAYGSDTIAGYSTILSTSKITPNSDVVIIVKKPDGSLVNVPSRTDAKGIAKVDLYDYHTRKAGLYEVAAYAKGQPESGATSFFRVYPDEISVNNSTIVARSTVALADGSDPVYLSVSLMDQYGNAFEGHNIKVISSRQEDSIKSSNFLTDSNGSANFIISSDKAGLSVFSAIDLTSGIVLESRAQVAFLDEKSYINEAGGDLMSLIPVASAISAGPLNHFSVSDLPSSIQPNQNISFRVTAQDQNNLTVENYTGTVRFSVEGANSENVTLPEDYIFKAEDLGTHEFSLGLKFTTTGTYTVVVTDTSNLLIKGEKSVIVGSGQGSQQPGGQSGLQPSILSPVAGSYSNNVQNVSGSAPAGSKIKVFDNDMEIGSVQVGSSGSFTYQTSPLIDGEHKLYVVTVDSNNTVLQTSATIIFKIDTTPPIVDEVTIEPMTGISIGEIMNVSVLSEIKLSQAALIFDSEIFELSPSLGQDGVYVATLKAPEDPGVYPLDILVVDELGNEATYKEKALVTISADGSAVVTQESAEVPLEETTTGTFAPQDYLPSAGIPPSQVFGLIAFGSDKRVTMVWEAANDDGTIDHYKVYYGLDPANLDMSVDTIDASTTWYVPGLVNGKEYFFAVAAVDDEGLEGENLSDFVNAIPFQLEVQTALPYRPESELGAFGGDAYLRGAAIGQMPPEMVRNGPEMLWLFVGTGGIGALVRKLSKRKRLLK